MIPRSQIQAEQSVIAYTRRKARRFMFARLGNNAGTIAISTGNRVYVRLHGDGNQVTRALNSNSIQLVANLPVIVEEIHQGGSVRYEVIARASEWYSDDPYANTVGNHGWQHERKDFNLGGPDPVEVWTRARPELRGQENDTPAMNIWINTGKYMMANVEVTWLGGNSPTITAPAVAGTERCDLIYLNASNVASVQAGTATPYNPFVRAAKPTPPTAGYFPVAWVWTKNGQTTIEEDDIADARLSFGSAGSGSVAAHDILSAGHGDALAGAVVDGDIIIGNVTPKWSRLAISVPAANVRNVLGVDNGELRPSWKTALDAVAPTSVSVGGAASAGTSLIFSHRDHTHGAPATWTPAAHDMVTSHTYTGGAALDVFGLSAASTIAKLTPSSNPGAAAAILASNASGDITLQHVYATTYYAPGVDSGVKSVNNTDELLIGNFTLQGYLLMPGTNFGATEDGSFLFTSRYIAAQASDANVVFRTYDGATVSELMFLDRLGNVGIGGLSARTSPVFRTLVGGNVGFGVLTPSQFVSLSGQAARTFWMERHTTANTAGNNLSVIAGACTTGATNKNSGILKLGGTLATGSGQSEVQILGTNGTDNGATTDVTPAVMIDVINNKIGFFTATPVVKQTGCAVPTDLASSIAAITALRTALNNYGLTTVV